MIEESSPPEWDVAFSLLSDDADIADRIGEELSEGLDVFIFSNKQEILGGRDALDVFPRIFGEARLCVVLFREGWGETKYTRLEEDTLRDRRLEEGIDFLFFVRLDDAPIPGWFPKRMQWVRYEEEGPGGTARIIESDLQELKEGRRQGIRESRRVADHDPVPKSRYHRHEGGRARQVTIPTEPETCDACRAAVRFRPILRVNLFETDGEAATEEYLCPPCARERDVKVMIPDGMDEEVVYSPTNPTVDEHVRRLVQVRVLDILSDDDELEERGITKVGASLTSNTVSLTPSGPAKPDDLAGLPWLEIRYRELEQAEALSEHDMVRYMKHRLLEYLDEQGW